MPLKANADAALKKCPRRRGRRSWCKRTGGAIDDETGRDHWYHEEAAKVSDGLPARAR